MFDNSQLVVSFFLWIFNCYDESTRFVSIASDKVKCLTGVVMGVVGQRWAYVTGWNDEDLPKNLGQDDPLGILSNAPKSPTPAGR